MTDNAPGQIVVDIEDVTLLIRAAYRIQMTIRLMALGMTRRGLASVMLVAATSVVGASCHIPSTTPLIHTAEDDGEIITSEVAVTPTAGGAAVNPLSERAQRIKSGRETPAAPGARPVQIAPPRSPALSPEPPRSGRWDTLQPSSKFALTRSLGHDGRWQSSVNSKSLACYRDSGE